MKRIRRTQNGILVIPEGIDHDEEPLDESADPLEHCWLLGSHRPLDDDQPVDFGGE